MTIEVDIQYAMTGADLPAPDALEHWARAALLGANCAAGELTIRITSADEVQELNRVYRGKNQPTNVLSFPADTDLPPLPVPLLGDIVLSVETVAAEARAQQKPGPHHWAHLVVHGTLHLLGYDHMTAADAQTMEALEVDILAGLGIADPYQSPPNADHQGESHTHA